MFGITTRELAAEWLSTLRIGEESKQAYECLVRVWIEPELGSVKVSNLRPVQIDRLLLFAARCGRRPQTVRHIHKVLALMLKWAVREGLIDRSPMERVLPPKVPRARLEPPTVEEVRKLIDAAADLPTWPQGWFRVFLIAAAETGARRGELLALRWDDLRGDVITIRASVTDPRGGPVKVKSTKTDRVRRIHAPISIAEMRSLPKLGAYVFAVKHGALRSPNPVSDLFIALRNDLGIKVRLHDLRHFHATQLVAAGVDVMTVAQRLGHARASTTLDIYTHWLPSADEHAAEVIGRVMG